MGQKRMIRIIEYCHKLLLKYLHGDEALRSLETFPLVGLRLIGARWLFCFVCPAHRAQGEHHDHYRQKQSSEPA